MNNNKKLDRNALRVNQFFIVLFTAIAFLFQLPWLVAFTSAVMITGTVFPKAGLFKLFYFYLLKPAGLIRPDISEEDSAPHQFAQALGGIFLLLSFISLELNIFIIGWVLSIIVLALALVNLKINFCLGCYIYFQLNKSGLFKKKILKGEQHA